MFCTSCGTKNNEDGNYCKQCGLRLDKPSHNKISEKDFERAMPEDEQITALLERAYRARKDGDRLGAIALCNEALALYPNSTSCHSLLGQLYEQGGERDLAIEQYERVLALNPGSIADRVKLDELRGDVPSLVSTQRSQPHIVLADRGKDNAPLDIRVPSFVLACVALMVLGGIFTMQMLSRQRPNADATHTALANAGTQSGNSQNSANNPGGQSVPTDQQTPNYSALTGAGAQPIIIQTPATQTFKDYPYTGYPSGQPRLSDAAANRGPITTNSAQEDNKDDNKDVGSDKVRLNSPDDNKLTVSDAAPPSKVVERGMIKVNQAPTAGQTAPAVAADTSTGSSTKKYEGMADLLAQQSQYKQAGDAYIHALDGAGDETAYIYRRAAWCFEKAGEKATAVNYYQHGIDAANKLVTEGHQPEIAKNLIRECQTGIRACTN